MNVLIACEYSGRVREAFRKRGHNAWSCDLLPAEDRSPFHVQMDVGWFCTNIRRGPTTGWGKDGMPTFDGGVDLVIAHPPCTDLAVSGARWWPSKVNSQKDAITFFMNFTSLTCKWAIENPVGLMSTQYRKPDQIIQPWQFGHGETKATCLWLNGLPKLVPTNVAEGREAKCHRMAPGPNRWKERSRTYQGIADAMAEQWG